MTDTKELNLEGAFKRLEKLIAEQDKLDLETRLKKFEEATEVARLLFKRLDQAKKKVQILVKKNLGETTLVPFDEGKPEDETSEDAPT